MHELSVTKQIIEMIKEECNKNKIVSPKNITIELGLLTTYKSEPIQYYFGTLKEEHPLLKDAVLNIIEVPGKIRCNACDEITTVNEELAAFCPVCDATDITITQGKDLKLKSISD